MAKATKTAAPAAAGAMRREPSVSYVLGRLDLALRRYLAEGLASVGVTLPQYTALSVLRDRGALSNAQLARRVLITPQSTIKVIAALEKKGLITRVPDPDHGRILRTLLTPNGQDVLDACDRVAAQVEAKMLEELSPEERDALHTSLKSCVRMLGAGF
ncbi:MAG TPA: MarR family transcriptional regulator [Thermoleophilaceae bacterium]|jgi:DNA-binding MarR family transcriptional regulator